MRVTDEAIDRIKQMIMSGELQPGDRLPREADLAARLGLSRNSLREAVKAWTRTEGLSTYDRRDHTGLLRNLVVREGRRTGALQARLVTSPGDLLGDELAEAVPGHPGLSDDTLLDIARACPAGAIVLRDEQGEEIEVY